MSYDDYNKLVTHKLRGPYRWHADDRPTIFETERPAEAWIPHGIEGHIGKRCPACAAESAEPHRIYHRTNNQVWLEKEVKWQEETDRVMRDFDEQVAEHFAHHKPIGCLTCPRTPPLPKKPVRPFERLHK